MPLNTREVLLVVRAKDEATRILSQIGSAFGGLSGAVTALQNAQTGLQLEKQAMQFGQLGTALGAAKQDYATLGAEVGTLTALKRAGVEVDDEALAAARVDLAQRKEHIVGMQNEYDNRSALIDQQMHGNAVAQQEIAMQQQARKETMMQGAALVGIGVVFTAVGAIILKFYAGAIQSAIAYEEQSRKTLTQVSGFKASLEEIEKLGLDVAKAVPVPLEQIQAGLFDIFSSIPVANLEDAKRILTEMSKAAVAGATDLQTVARSNFELINAFGLGVDDLNHVLDVQFKLVQLGIGDYADINSGIGRLAPTAKTAGQSIDILGGSLAFMTRITGDGSQAVTAIQRAMESITNPKVQDNLAKFGVTVTDAFGGFRPFPDIVNDLANKLNKLPPVEKAAAIFDIFRSSGSGSKNTRQFFMAAIDNLDAFNSTMNQVGDNAGAMQQAFGIMSDSTASKIQQMHNNMEATKIMIGNALLPIFNQLLEALMAVGHWFGGLSDSTKRYIIIGTLIAAVLMVLVGVILIVSGVILILTVAFTMLDGALAPIILIVALVVLAILVLVAVGYLIYRNWSTIVDAASFVWHYVLIAWNAIKDGVVAAAEFAWEKLKAFWHWVQDTFSTIFTATKDFIISAWETIKSAIGDAWQWIIDKVTGGNLEEIWNAIFQAVKDITREVVETLVVNFNRTVAALHALWTAVDFVFNIIRTIIEFVMPYIVDIIQRNLDIIQAVWNFIWPIFRTVVENTWNQISNAISIATEVISRIIGDFTAVISGLWNFFWPLISQVVSLTWDFISSVIVAAITIISNIIQFVLNIIQGDWGQAWDNIKTIVKTAWDQIWAGITFVWGLIKAFFAAFGGNVLTAIGDLASKLLQKGKDLLQGLFDGIAKIWMIVYTWFVGLPGYVLNALGDMTTKLVQAGKDLINGLKNGIIDAAQGVLDSVTDIVGSIKDTVVSGFSLGSPSKVMKEYGQFVGKGFELGLVTSFTQANKSLDNLLEPSEAFTMSNSGRSFSGGDNQTTLNIAPGAIVINGVTVDNIDDKINEAFEQLITEINRR